MNEHTILVAFTVESDEGPEEARYNVHGLLTYALSHADLISRDNGITQWWIAEDDRQDGSDNDSAVFVTPGNQARASHVLYGLGLTPECNIVTHGMRGS